jgi:UDP-N-acetylmuramoyl-L-alanyl-D-glutamate--2,6-diaminopimelate ligase
MRNLLAIVRLLPGAIVHGDGDAMAVDVTNDSRQVQRGWIFVAIAGTNVDSHEHIAAAVASGASGVIGQRPFDDVALMLGKVPYVQVADSRLAFAIATHLMLNEPTRGVRFYGVTGTNGKTTCATILEQIFASAGRVVGFIGTTGIRYAGSDLPSDYTTPHARALCDVILRMKDAGVDTICMEVSSHALDQHRVYGVQFQGAMFTNLTRDHLDYHGTMDAYAAAKKKLFDGLPTDAVAVVNADDAWAEAMTRDCKARTIVRVGLDDDATAQIDDVELTSHGTSFSLTLPHASSAMRIATPLVGAFNVTNVALCAVMAVKAGIEPSKVVDILRSVRGPAGRMERYVLASGAVAVVDYAHTPDALRNALVTLRELVGRARLHVVFGCGGDRDKGKRPEMGRIASDLADVLWITSDNPRSEDPQAIIDEIRRGVHGDRSCVEIHEDRAVSIRAALDDARPGDIVLIAGKGHETYQIIGAERRHFSDMEQVAAWNAAHRATH